MKKLISAFLALLMLGAFACAAFADEVPQPEAGMKFENDWAIPGGLVQIDYEEEGYRVTLEMDGEDGLYIAGRGKRFIIVHGRRNSPDEPGARIMRDAGITPTKKDSAAIKAGKVPVSFLVTEKGLELNGRAYTLIGRLVYERMESLGYFDEVFDELAIGDTTLRILKDDPTYFERILKNRLN